MSNVFVCNVYNPSLPNAESYIISSAYGERCKRLAQAEKKSHDNGGPLMPIPSKAFAVEFMKKWVANHIIGAPQVPDGSSLTVEELKERGYIGLYSSTSGNYTRRFETETSINNQG